jgi:hypothetical protein
MDPSALSPLFSAQQSTGNGYSKAGARTSFRRVIFLQIPYFNNITNQE